MACQGVRIGSGRLEGGEGASVDRVVGGHSSIGPGIHRG